MGQHLRRRLQRGWSVQVVAGSLRKVSSVIGKEGFLIPGRMGRGRSACRGAWKILLVTRLRPADAFPRPIGCVVMGAISTRSLQEEKKYIPIPVMKQMALLASTATRFALQCPECVQSVAIGTVTHV